MSNLKWEIGPVKLADGTEAYIDYVQPESKHYRYIGRAKDSDDIWRSMHWCDMGWVPYTTTGYAKNLAPPPKKTLRVRLWANVYEDGSMFSYPTKKQADDSAQYGRFACIEIDREVEEGEGLDPNVRSDAANVRSRNP